MKQVHVLISHFKKIQNTNHSSRIRRYWWINMIVQRKQIRKKG